MPKKEQTTNLKITYNAEDIARDATRMVAPYADRAIPLAITTREECETAAGVLAEIKGQARNLEDRRKEITGPLDDAKKRIMDLFRAPAAALAEAERAIKAAIGKFHEDQERIRIEQERAQRELQQREQERLRKLAAKAEERGDTAKAEEFAAKEQQVASFQPTGLAEGTAGIQGMSIRKNWTFRITDEAKIPREYLIPNETMIGKFAQATKGKVQLPGIEIYEETSIASRSRG